MGIINANASPSSFLSVIFILLFLLSFPSSALAADGGCGKSDTSSEDRSEALKLKVLAIFIILAMSMAGVCLPLFSRYLPALSPDRDLFVVVKAFASGVILATAYMHVLPDSFEDLGSECLPARPWGEFPFTAFIAMLSSLLTLMLDSFILTFLERKHCSGRPAAVAAHSGSPDCDDIAIPVSGVAKDVDKETKLLRYRIVAQVLEAGIVVHSVVIGLALGASETPSTIKPLIAALCFHQLFEGMGLGGSILQAEYTLRVRAVMVFFFSVTTPFGIALGIGLTEVYEENSPTALIVVGVLNAASAGILIYTALVDLLAADFLGPRLQGSAQLQAKAYAAVLLGAGGMSLMAKWA